MKTVREVLVAARALIDTPEKWTKGQYARRHWRGGTPVMPDNDEATCFCSSGAVRRVLGQRGLDWSLTWRRACEVLQSHCPEGTDLVGFNDAPTTTHADVMVLFDRAIAACPEDES